MDTNLIAVRSIFLSSLHLNKHFQYIIHFFLALIRLFTCMHVYVDDVHFIRSVNFIKMFILAVISPANT